MKNKILPFIIGVLVGAIIATAGFLVYEKTNTNNETSNFERPREMMNHGDGETPPDRPDGEMKFDRQKNNQNTTESTT